MDTADDTIAFPPAVDTDGWIILDGSGHVVPTHDKNDHPIIYSSRRAAEMEIADDMAERLRQFRDGEGRELDDICWGETAAPCTVYPDGVISIEGCELSLEEFRSSFR